MSYLTKKETDGCIVYTCVLVQYTVPLVVASDMGHY